MGVDINANNDFLFFDEIGECPAALSSLKFFVEQRPDLYLCASGSNIGLLNSFPVGKVEALELLPMSFEELVMASGNGKILEAFRRGLQIQAAHNKLWDLLLDYYFVGGMPEAVETWFADGGKFSGINECCNRIQNIHLPEHFMR
nr:AAA family ATPase [Thalassotalea sp. G20_0]